MITNMCVPICNHFHTRKAKGVKITCFRGGTPLWCPSSRGTLHPVAQNFVTKN